MENPRATEREQELVRTRRQRQEESMRGVDPDDSERREDETEQGADDGDG